MTEQLDKYIDKNCKIYMKKGIFRQGKITDIGTLFLTLEDRYDGPTIIALTEISQIREVGE